MASQPGDVGPSGNTPRTGDFYPSVSKPELEPLLALVHRDPHSILGAHPSPGGVIVRAFRPEAERVELLLGDESPKEMVKSHPHGFFELLLEGRRETFPYQLRVHYAAGDVYTLRDPYAFLPTLGSFDEHLFGEGRHEQGYRVGLPGPGSYRQILNTDNARYGGSGVGQVDSATAEALPLQGQPYSIMLDLPPLATTWFEVPHD